MNDKQSFEENAKEYLRTFINNIGKEPRQKPYSLNMLEMAKQADKAISERHARIEELESLLDMEMGRTTERRLATRRLTELDFRFISKVHGDLFEIIHAKSVAYSKNTKAHVVADDRVCFWDNSGEDHALCISTKHILME